MNDTVLRSGAERSYPLSHAGPDARFTEALVPSVTAVLVGYGYARLATSADRAALESALAAFLYNPMESHA
ncbi:hypothetical protein [Streptomyces caniscabiei]|uniref:TetR family transcriptional regulator n=1 Tax=Streptomyces caniscabiei TaxID=2746961 RepID=A0ABU4N432_9ACTN|nr:hypothetical protein [Streptomyces caniscabiei]MBE4741970.1 hypothetical protein [Streptomyces caniscabiei]MBE4753801.1 hypothetical protein [Streptomyces caniscabiei]MBE4775998.1 hypothetical protein [Streptomyces caniscabiei]MBE4790790.1 hypothetical protein [Streptomyces caniscabiei]MBE4799959.1 hypothetical protein [Streptomyces caniscabiei]